MVVILNTSGVTPVWEEVHNLSSASSFYGLYNSEPRHDAKNKGVSCNETRMRKLSLIIIVHFIGTPSRLKYRVFIIASSLLYYLETGRNQR